MDFSGFTSDQLSAILAAADNTLFCCGCAIAKAGEGEPLPYEPELVEVLLKQWGTANPKAVERAVAFIQENGGELTDQYIEAISKVISQTLDKEFTVAVRSDVVELFSDSYKFAKGTVLEEAGVTVDFNFLDEDAIKWLQNDQMYWVGNYYDRILSDELRNHVAQGVKDGLGRADIGSSLKTFFDDYPGIASKPEAYWRGLAANGMNRSRNFGLVPGYQEVGVKEFDVIIVDDERTSEVCKAMAGKRFTIEMALNQRDQLMQATGPDAVKQASPWLTADQVRDVSPTILASMGVCMPPYHFHCRTTIVAA